METVIYEAGQPIGALKMEPDGLYWHVSCQLDKSRELRRLYAVHGWESVYLGIPDAQGRLTTRIPRKQLREADCALSVPTPRGKWNPWRGKVNDVMLEQCYIQHTEQGIRLALPDGEEQRFPWTEDAQREQVYGVPMAILSLDTDGNLPQIEREIGGRENDTYESNETNSYADIDPLLLADLPADYSYGESGTEP